MLDWAFFGEAALAAGEGWRGRCAGEALWGGELLRVLKGDYGGGDCAREGGQGVGGSTRGFSWDRRWRVERNLLLIIVAAWCEGGFERRGDWWGEQYEHPISS